MLRKILATWAVLQFLGVGGYVAFAAYGDYEPTHGGIDKFFQVLLSTLFGIMGGCLSVALPLLVLMFCFWMWSGFAPGKKNNGSNYSDNLTLGDIAGIASAVHPRAGALLNVAANIDARTQALTVVQPAPTHNRIDDERL
jgi:hypothetical protein